MYHAAIDGGELQEGMTLLDRYTIIDRIAGGGMATIYRATDERLDRVVCVKLLRLVVEGTGSTSDGGSVYQATYSHFHKEALALSKLQHPNTLRIYDFGYLDGDRSFALGTVAPLAEEGRPFQVSEFLDGGNLEQHVRVRGRLKAVEALAILERISGAVAEAHAQQIIHRDIKPSNILFSRVGEVLMPKLADFGIARCDLRKRPRPGEPEDTLQIVSTVPLFSPRWAAPEQLAGDDEEGPATDVYALGLVASFMLAGRAPFDVDDVRSTFSERIRGDDFLIARLAEIGLPAEARRVLVDAMRANALARIDQPLAFYEELSRALGGTRTTLPPQELPARPPMESITLELSDDRQARAAPPPERWVDLAGRRVRVVEVHEKVDVVLPGHAGDARFRITLLPSRAGGYRLNLKGLNCFVAKRGGTASPAIVADVDGSATFVATDKTELGTILWSFGRPSESGRMFRAGQGELAVASAQALALDLGESRELIVICRRA